MNTLPDTIAVLKPDQGLVDGASQRLVSAKASYAVIKTGDEYEAAALDLQAIKTAQKNLEAERKKITVPLNQVVDAVNALFKKPAAALAEAEGVIKTSMIGYNNEQERIRREQEAKAAEQLRKDREKLEEQSAKALAKGNVERAEALAQTAAALPQTVEIASAAPKVSGIAGRSTWQAAVKDKPVFLKYVAEHPEWTHLIDLNMVALNGLARSQKSALALPGIEAIEVQGLSARAA